MASFFLGIDIGGTTVKVGLVSEAGELLASTKVVTRPESGPEEMVARALSAGHGLVGRHGASPRKLERIGVGCAGLIKSPEGVLLTSPNLSGWEDVPLGKILAEAGDVDVFLDNDANAFAYGEACVGSARGKSFGVFLTIGTGVGGGLLLDGALYRGSNGFGAELGHVVIDPDGPECKCGSRGCLESFARSKTIVETAIAYYREAGRIEDLERMGEGDSPGPTSEMLSRAASSGDDLAVEVFREAGKWIGVAIGGFINAFNPQVVVIGGGVAQAGDHLFVPVRHWAGRCSFSASFNCASIVPASLGETAGLVGAALEARDRCGIPCR